MLMVSIKKKVGFFVQISELEKLKKRKEKKSNIALKAKQTKGT